MISVDEFRSSKEAPPAQSAALCALWHDAHGDWDAAHQFAQAEGSAECAWVHAYLHRKEGDNGNAGYWYRRAGRPPATGSLEAEWRAIVDAIIRSDKGRSVDDGRDRAPAAPARKNVAAVADLASGGEKRRPTGSRTPSGT